MRRWSAGQRGEQAGGGQFPGRPPKGLAVVSSRQRISRRGPVSRVPPKVRGGEEGRIFDLNKLPTNLSTRVELQYSRPRASIYMIKFVLVIWDIYISGLHAPFL